MFARNVFVMEICGRTENYISVLGERMQSLLGERSIFCELTQNICEQAQFLLGEHRIVVRALQSFLGDCSTFACKRRSFASDAMFREATQEFCDLKYKVGERNAFL